MEQTSFQTTDDVNIVLFLNIGAVNTRVILLEKKGFSFQFIGAVSSRTIYTDAGEVSYRSIVNTVTKLENATGKHFMDDTGRIVSPRKLEIIGVDQVILTWNSDESPRIVLMGLTEDRSLAGLRDLLGKNGLLPQSVICAMDGKSMTENIDRILDADPDLVLVAGGMEEGAERAVYRLGEILLLACRSIARESRPKILFCGNSAAQSQFGRVFGKISDISFARNILNPEKTDDDAPAEVFQKCMLEFVGDHNPAFTRLNSENNCAPISEDYAYSRFIRLLSRMNHEARTTLGIEVGASRTITAFSRDMELEMNRFPVGIGNTISGVLEKADLAELVKQVGFKLKPGEIKDYIYNKNYHPAMVPANRYSAEIEQVVAGEIIRQALKENPSAAALTDGTLGTVFLGGSVLRNVENPGDALWCGMNAVRALGAVDYYLDLHGLAPLIGAAASANPSLAADIAAPTVFMDLGRVITPVSKVKEGKRAFSVSIRDESGNLEKHDVIQGRITRIPLKFSRHYELDWYNVNKAVELPGIQTWTPMEFRSGCFGLVFDLRNDNSWETADSALTIAQIHTWKQQLGTWNSEG